MLQKQGANIDDLGMDLLKRELERKKKSVQKAKSATGGRRFFRASDLRRQEEEEEAKKQEHKVTRKHARSSSSNEDEHVENISVGKKKRGGEKCAAIELDASLNKEGQTNEEEKLQSKSISESIMSSEEVAERLRSLGYPVRLFGEGLMDRLKRLRKALDELKSVQASNEESSEFRLGKGHGIRNPFLIKDDVDTEPGSSHVHSGTDHHDANAAGATTNSKEDGKGDKEDEDLDDADPHKRVYKYFKGLCKQWEEDLNLRPEAVKRTVAGRNETKTLKQCRDYIKPMFKLLKGRRMDEGILSKLNQIVTCCLEEEFVKAHDTYIDISIGRAAWPIGVTSKLHLTLSDRAQ